MGSDDMMDGTADIDVKPVATLMHISTCHTYILLYSNSFKLLTIVFVLRNLKQEPV